MTQRFPTLAPTCNECGAEIARGLLACPGCARLVYATELESLAAAARYAETAGDATKALGLWRRTLALLPPGTAQGDTIQQKMVALSARVDGRAPAAAQGKAHSGAKKGAWAGGASALGLALLKSKALLLALFANGKLLLLGLLKLPTLLSMLLFLRWGTGGGLGFAVGVVASLYVHEMGHVAALRRYGIEASAPMFVPGFGAFVRLNQYPTDAHEEARTGLAGPLWGLFAASVAAIVGELAGSPTTLGVASLGATINCFNLIPVWQLDGARGLRALSQHERMAVAAVGILTGVATHQWMPGIVGLVTALRAFGGGAHPTGDRKMALLFAALIVAHGLIAMLPVGRGF